MQIIFLLFPVISLIGAIFSVINAIDSYREYCRIRDEFREKIKEETYKKMDNDLKKFGFVTNRGTWL